MALFDKQKEFTKAFKSGKYLIYGLGGGTNSGKTIVSLSLLHSLCLAYPGTRWAVVRKSDRILKTNTIPSFFKVISFMGTKEVPTVNYQDLVAKYSNGSEVLFVWADISKDKDKNRVKGLEVAGMVFDEANEVDEGYFSIAMTRVGRFNIDKYGNRAPQFIICTFNPNNTWVKSLFYDRDNSNTLPKDWFFQLSLPSDNPELTKEQKQMYKSMSLNDYNRYVLGNWEYDANPAQLITYEMYRDCCITQEELNGMIEREELKGDTLLSIDPADEGKDSTAFVYIKGNVFYKYEKDPNLDAIKSAHLAKERILEHNVSHTIVDSIGVGAGTYETLKYEDYEVTPFISSEAPETEDEFYHYKNKRAEAGWLLRKSMKGMSIMLLHNPEVQKQLLAIEWETVNRGINIVPKKVIKKKLGYSPDYYDAISAGNYLRLIHEGIIAVGVMIDALDSHVDMDNIVEKYDF